MTHMIQVTQSTHRALIKLGAGLFEPSEVVEKLVQKATTGPETTVTTKPNRVGNVPRRGAFPNFYDTVANDDGEIDYQTQLRRTRQEIALRMPRERGVAISIGNHRIVAESVPDLYLKTMQHIVDSGLIASLKPLIPFATSTKRYLISDSSIHPNGASFVVPVRYAGYHMEAHKSYQTAINALRKFFGRIDIQIIYPA